MSREEKINKMIEGIKIRRNDEQYKGGPFPIYHIEFDILNEEIERLNNIINELKWKQIEKYDKGNYDWVLVKYFDGDYECVPCVAEKRFGKWYSIDEKEIQFDVKFFMDMQQIDKLQELKESDISEKCM